MANTHQIDAHIAKRQEEIKRLEVLRQMANDPEMLTLMKALVTENGAGVSHKADATVPHYKRSAVRRKGNRKGDLQEAVIKTIANISGRFSAPSVVETMNRAGFVFDAGKPNIAVNSVFRRLVEKQQLVVAVQGSGRSPNEYEHATERTKASQV